MTEHSKSSQSGHNLPRLPASISLSPDVLKLGESSFHRDASGINISINEPTKPFFQRMPSRVVGDLKLEYKHAPHKVVQLDSRGAHHWMGVAPHARLTVRLSEPDISFTGSAYHDSNWGTEPLENRFESWTWSRAEVPQGTMVLYDIIERDYGPRERALLFHRSGEVEELDDLQHTQLRGGGWGVKRSTRVDLGATSSLYARLIDSPFYTRDLINTRLLGHDTIAMHEALDLRRFKRGWVRFLLPFRIRVQ